MDELLALRQELKDTKSKLNETELALEKRQAKVDELEVTNKRNLERIIDKE